MSDTPTLAEGIGRIHDESRGMMNLHVIRREDAPRLLLAALAGDKEAGHLLHQVSQSIAQIEAAPARAPVQCGCCGSNLTNGRFSFAIATPDIADPSAGLGMAICWRCGTSLGVVRAAAVRALRLIWPNCRAVTVHPEGGRA